MGTETEAERLAREAVEKAAFLEEMGRRIKKSLNDLGLSETRFSWQAQMHETLLRRWIKGTTNPTATGLAKLARELGVSTDYLLQLTDDPSPRRSAESPT